MESQSKSEQENKKGITEDMIILQVDQCLCQKPIPQESEEHLKSIGSSDYKKKYCQKNESLLVTLLKEHITKSDDVPKTFGCQVGDSNGGVGKSQGQTYEQKQVDQQQKISESSISSQVGMHPCQINQINNNANLIQKNANQTTICKTCKFYTGECQQKRCSPLCVKVKKQILENRQQFLKHQQQQQLKRQQQQQLKRQKQLQRNIDENLDIQTQGDQANECYKCHCNQQGCQTSKCGCIQRGLQCNQLCQCDPSKCQFYRDRVKRPQSVFSESGSDVNSGSMKFKQFSYLSK